MIVPKMPFFLVVVGFATLFGCAQADSMTADECLQQLEQAKKLKGFERIAALEKPLEYMVNASDTNFGSRDLKYIHYLDLSKALRSQIESIDETKLDAEQQATLMNVLKNLVIGDEPLKSEITKWTATTKKFAAFLVIVLTGFTLGNYAITRSIDTLMNEQRELENKISDLDQSQDMHHFRDWCRSESYYQSDGQKKHLPLVSNFLLVSEKSSLQEMQSLVGRDISLLSASVCRSGLQYSLKTGDQVNKLRGLIKRMLSLKSELIRRSQLFFKVLKRLKEREASERMTLLHAGAVDVTGEGAIDQKDEERLLERLKAALYLSEQDSLLETFTPAFFRELPENAQKNVLGILLDYEHILHPSEGDDIC